MGALDNLFGQMSDVGTTLSGLGDNTPLGIPNPVGAPGNPLAAVQPSASQQTTTPDTEDAMEMFQRLVAENEPLLRASRNAALKTPDKREEEIYKQKIQQMFGVKLGEKNPKWRSALRGITEGLDSLAAGYNRTPTIREKARRQAQEDYKLENEVLGKDSTATLARMGQAAQQANVAKIAQEKKAMGVEIARLRNDPASPKAQEHAARAALLLEQGKTEESKRALNEANAEKSRAQAKDTGQTNQSRNATIFGNKPELLNPLAKVSAASKVKLQLPGEGEYTAIPTNRWQAVTGPDGNITNRPIPGERLVKKPVGFSNLDALDDIFRKAGSPDKQVPSTETTPAPPMQSTAPAGGDGKPYITKQPTPTTVNPNPTAPLAKNLNPQKVVENHDDYSATERQLENELKRKGTIFSRDKQKAYESLKDQVRGGRGIMGSLFGTMFSFDGEGTPSLQNAAGVRGKLNTIKGKYDGKIDPAITIANQSFRKINDDYRRFVTGQGAGMPELKRIAERYPALGDTASAFEGPEYAIQKGLALHFMASLQKYRMLQEEAAPDSLGTFFPEKEVGDRIGQITNLYKKMRDILPKTAPGDRKKVAEQYRKVIGELSDPMKLYADTYRAQFGDLSKAPRY